MAIYNSNGITINNAYGISGISLNSAYDIDGIIIFNKEQSSVDYSDYSFVQKWGSKGIGSTQGFDIYDDKVFWVSKSGNSSIPSNCYVWNLSDGSQALEAQPITVYSGHGNNLCFAFPKLYATSAYTPHVYVNSVTDNFEFALIQTLYINDGCIDCDACIDEYNSNILYTLGHTATASDITAPYIISIWDLTSLVDGGDGTFTPRKIQSVFTQQPSNSFYFQGVKMHDGILWYANGYSGSSTGAFVFGVNPITGEVLYSINCETTAEPEGVAWVEDENVAGGYAMYVGFAGMMLRKYTFGLL